jgi:hypothetical protein
MDQKAPLMIITIPIPLDICLNIHFVRLVYDTIFYDRTQEQLLEDIVHYDILPVNTKRTVFKQLCKDVLSLYIVLKFYLEGNLESLRKDNYDTLIGFTEVTGGIRLWLTEKPSWEPPKFYLTRD